MLNFLRKLRRTNMNSKYLKYALGEIVLVVIGILIALSINNWNEQRKDEIIETQILDDMLVSLKSDRSIFLMLENRLLEKDDAIQYLLDLREQGKLPTGRKFGELMGVARQQISFTYDKSPYESLVALGINKMSNKHLLNEINKYYTQELPRCVKFLENIDARYRPVMEASEALAVESGVLKKYFIKRENDEKWSVQYESEPDRLLNDELFYQSLITDFQYMENSLGRLKTLIRDNHQMIELLENE